MRCEVVSPHLIPLPPPPPHPHPNTQYGTKIVPENVMVFAGGRPGIFAVLAFLKKHVQVRIGNAEWPAYLDIMTQ